MVEEWLGEKVRTEPDANRHQIYDRCFGLYKLALEQNRALFEKMGELGS